MSVSCSPDHYTYIELGQLCKALSNHSSIRLVPREKSSLGPWLQQDRMLLRPCQVLINGLPPPTKRGAGWTSRINVVQSPPQYSGESETQSLHTILLGHPLLGARYNHIALLPSLSGSWSWTSPHAHQPATP
ncbi:hypothetical protein THAOC_36476 [Thalassiosira oceanica]|uniref:Uncharacterized protein n=1 Tax=Thalassiosira oceanica TaxID=159749 RepID=K0R835_THAOC|nr:hypothetical protein THAOC_36476 [Thalassiosira oceanica]|eukprot:EJK44946.1 hypothetical protein THAOC_36476 [Thalassiosira oceanica]